MKNFGVLLICIQACFVQDVFSQCFGQYGPAVGPGFNPNAIGPATLGPYGYPGVPDYGYPGNPGPCGLDSYGGVGEGNVAVAGELPVAGTTAIAGQVPIMGAVNFGGAVPAAGVVTISGNCACGCGGPYIY